MSLPYLQREPTPQRLFNPTRGPQHRQTTHVPAGWACISAAVPGAIVPQWAHLDACPSQLVRGFRRGVVPAIAPTPTSSCVVNVLVPQRATPTLCQPEQGTTSPLDSRMRHYHTPVAAVT